MRFILDVNTENFKAKEEELNKVYSLLEDTFLGEEVAAIRVIETTMDNHLYNETEPWKNLLSKKQLDEDRKHCALYLGQKELKQKFNDFLDCETIELNVSKTEKFLSLNGCKFKYEHEENLRYDLNILKATLGHLIKS